jgi:hypothetical protein
MAGPKIAHDMTRIPLSHLQKLTILSVKTNRPPGARHCQLLPSVRLLLRNAEIGELGSINRTMLTRIVPAAPAPFPTLFHFRQQLPGPALGADWPSSQN